MKKAIHILDTIYRIVLTICILGLALLIVLSITQRQYSAEIVANYDYFETEEQYLAALTTILVFSIIELPFCIAGLVFTFLNEKLISEPTNRRKYILYGVLSIVFSLTVPGILLIVEGAVNGRKREY